MGLSVFTSVVAKLEATGVEGSSFLIAMFSMVVMLEASDEESTLGSDTLKSIPLQDSAVVLVGSSLTAFAGEASLSTSGTLRLVGAPRSRGCSSLT